MSEAPPVNRPNDDGSRPDAAAAGSAALQEALAAAIRLLRLLLVGVFVAYVASGAFVVPQHERAFVLRFGRIADEGAERLKGPGLHWAWPRPVSEVVRVPAERVQIVSTTRFWHDARTDPVGSGEGGSMPTPSSSFGYSLTGDANVFHHRWSVHYTIADPQRYLFSLREVDALIRAELERAVSLSSAQFPIDRALRTDLAGFRSAVEGLLRVRVEQLNLGIRLQAVYLTAVAPPPATAAAFDEAAQAAQFRDREINEARAASIRMLNEAEAEAARIRAHGVAERRRRAAAVAAWADAFAALREPWQRHRAIVEQSLRQNVLREVLPRVGRIVVAPDGATDDEIRLNFGAPQRMTEDRRP